MQVTLTLTVSIHDEAALLSYARQRVIDAWPGTTLDDLVGNGETETGRAVYEALIGSNEDTTPMIDYGIEMVESTVVVNTLGESEISLDAER